MGSFEKDKKSIEYDELKGTINVFRLGTELAHP